jgi:hypothetical protein
MPPWARRARAWLKRCNLQVNAEKFDSAAANGETVTSQADPINLLHRVELARQFRRFGTVDAAMRNLALQINGVGIGRPGEVLTFSFDLLTWDCLLLLLLLCTPMRLLKTNRRVRRCWIHTMAFFPRRH